MKAPGHNVHPMTRPMTAPTTTVPPAYYAMAAAHMSSMGKQVFADQAPPSPTQITQAVNAPPSQ